MNMPRPRGVKATKKYITILNFKNIYQFILGFSLLQFCAFLQSQAISSNVSKKILSPMYIICRLQYPISIPYPLSAVLFKIYWFWFLLNSTQLDCFRQELLKHFSSKLFFLRFFAFSFKSVLFLINLFSFQNNRSNP